MKFLFFTDTHIKTNNPSSRIDDYPTTLKKKLTEIAEIGEREKVDYYLHGGDLFDRPDISIRTVKEYVSIFKNFHKPIYMISGNHDIFGHNPKTIDRTIMSLLSVLDVFHLIDSDDPIILNKNDLRVQVSGSPYHYNIDSSDKKSYHPERLEDIDYHILLIHSLLLKNPFLESIQHSLIEEIQDPNIDVVLAGHYHSGFKETKYKNSLFFNPGSVVRISNSQPEVERIPKVLILNLSKDRIDYHYVSLKSAKPGLEVLTSKTNEAKLRQENLENFKVLMQQTSNVNSYDIKDILLNFSKTKKISRTVIDMAFERLAKAEMENENT